MIAQTWSPAPYRTRVDAQWIDYNGHMRDAFYSLVISLATDDLMDQLGMDAAYRAATRHSTTVTWRQGLIQFRL